VLAAEGFESKLSALFGDGGLEDASNGSRSGGAERVELVFNHDGEVFGNDRGGESASGVASHAVGDDEEADFGLDAAGILIGAADSADVGHGGPAERRRYGERLFELYVYSGCIDLGIDDRQGSLVDEAFCAPGAVIPVIAVDGPSAGGARFGEREGCPCLADFSAAPGTVAHEAHELAAAVSAVVMP